MKKTTWKLLCLVLCVAMLATLFVGCDGGSTEYKDEINYDIDLTPRWSSLAFTTEFRTC